MMAAQETSLALVRPPEAELLDHPLISQVEVIGVREGGLIDCWVPTSLIDHEEVPVKQEYAESLAKEMRQLSEAEGGTGQLTPIVLGLIEGEDNLRIIDGFHRDAALKINGQDRIYATVLKTDWDGLFDIRIFTAKDHAQVRFSRVVQWIGQVWQFSGLADKLTVEQAVLLYRFDSSGTKLHLTPDDVAAAKAWVARKEEQWQMAAMTIHSHLKIAENVDPALVHSTREKKGGHTLEAPTQAILKIFSEELPNSFALQNLVMEAAKANNLKGPQVKALCLSVRNYRSLKAAQTFIKGIDWQSWQPEYHESTERALRRAYDPRHKGAAVLQGPADEISRIIERVNLSITRGEEVTPQMQIEVRAAREKATRLSKDLGVLVSRLSVLLGETRATRTSTAKSIVYRPPEENKPEAKKDPHRTVSFNSYSQRFEIAGKLQDLQPIEDDVMRFLVAFANEGELIMSKLLKCIQPRRIKLTHPLLLDTINRLNAPQRFSGKGPLADIQHRIIDGEEHLTVRLHPNFSTRALSTEEKKLLLARFL